MDSATVEYLFPESVEDASGLMQQYGDRARFIAGGTDLLLLMERQHYHPEALIDLTCIEALHRLDADDGRATIGAAVTYNQLLAFPPICTAAPFLAKAIRTIGGVQVRNVATLVGNITNASPAADTLPALYVMNAQVHTFGPQGSRSLPIDEFVLGVRQTALMPAELVTNVTFDLPEPDWHGAFDKLGLRRAMAIAVASVAVMLRLDGDHILQARLALGAVAPTVIRVPAAEDALSGHALDEDSIARAARLASEITRPIDDVRGSAEYRTQVVSGLVKRALGELRAKVGSQE